MNNSLRSGLGFGITSAIITTLGLMMGLLTSTESKLAVLGGVITIALADALSDAMGMHISQEYSKHTTKNVWKATFATFGTKLLVGLTFILAIILLPLYLAAIVNVTWGILLLCVFNYFVAKADNENPIKVIFEHLFIVILVLIVTFFLGKLIHYLFV